MNFNDYQDFALNTATYPQIGENLVYPAMGCAGEGGEFCDKAKKYWRNTGSMSALGMQLSPKQKQGLIEELGDQLWYIAASARELGITLEEIVATNISKITDRRARGVVKGEGDNR